MSINWQKLRPWNGSQYSAFEELCCQLARYDPTPQGSNFIRKGSPDAGIECYWQLPSGDIWGWQAKFFLSSPDESQWRQIDDSVKTAIEKHARLTRLTISLPVDRSDPHIDNQKWFMDKWSDHVAKWQKWVNARRMSTEFDYWGEHEIWERLSLDVHRGRHFFWFNEESFSGEWFEARISEAVANVGPRYTPKLNVKLPIARLFEGLGRTAEFFNQIKISYGEISRAYKKTLSRKAESAAKNEFASLDNNINALLSNLKNIDKLEIRPLDFDLIGKLASQASDNAWQCERKLTEVAENLKKQLAAEKQESGQSSTAYHEEEFGYERHHLYGLVRHLDEINEFASSREAHLANIPALLLAGDAGTGKTHLYCDIAKQRVGAKLPTLLLLGGQFSGEEPWSQIIRLLGLSCTREELLGALESAALARGARALILIDALNEGEGKKLWHKYTAGMLTILSRHPWIGIAVSVRTSYTRTVIPDGLVPDRLILMTHRGFSDHEYQATRTFFSHFGIERPSVPLLVPEFQNPLFLKLFCQGLKNKGVTKVPSGLQGITAIFSFFIDSINEKLSQPESMDFDPKSKLVQSAIEKLVELMADRGQTWLPRAEAQAAVNSFLPRDGYENSLFRQMVAEGLLAEDRYRTEDAWHEGIHFSYERFSDHLIAKHLLDKHLDAENPGRSFQSNQVLGSLVNDENSCWQNRGIIEAFLIQIPERINQELTSLVPSIAEYQAIQAAFIQSLIWREPTAITEFTRQYINATVIKYKVSHDQFLNALLIVTANPKHPYNADFLHKQLLKFELAERDAWWSIFLHHQHGEHGAVDRLLEWAWSDEDKSHIEDESLKLTGIALAWFLTTSNRFLRDRATKALVALLEKRIPVLQQILEKFVSVNDPYILERLFAVAYGCATRSTDAKAIGVLARRVYEWIFKDGTPPPHILLRDYARGVVEAALHHGVELDIDSKKVRPPYSSEWPSFDIPSKEELKKYGEWREEKTEAEKALSSLYYSTMGGSDFDRYVIGTNSGSFEWSTHRLGKKRKPTKLEAYNKFVQALTKKQETAWRKYLDTRHQAIKIILSSALGSDKKIIRLNKFSDKENERRISRAKQIFNKTLSVKQRRTFQDQIIPYLDRPPKEEARFDLSIAQCWIFKRVLDLGWTAERFGEFDWNINRHSNYGRESRKPERIGKKYQWIAYYEFLARISDNFEFKGESWSDRREKYEGPWQIGYVRNIDPTCLIKSTKRQDWQPHSNTWWFPVSYDTWDSEPDDVKWLKTSTDLPAIEPLLEVVDPSDNSKWLVMETYCKYEQPTPIEEDRFELPRRDIYYMIKSYIVKKSDIGKVYEWAKNQNYRGGWMPESHSLYRVMLGEFYWSPAFLYHDIPYYSHNGWNQGTREKLPKKVLVSSDKYMHESNSYDCSIDETINIDLPAKWIVDQMSLRWNGVEGHFFDVSGKLIAFDPSVRCVGPSALLINRDALLKFLNQNGYDILWTVLGEKNFIGGGLSVGNWKGRLEINGAYRIYQDKIMGKLNTKFLARE